MSEQFDSDPWPQSPSNELVGASGVWSGWVGPCGRPPGYTPTTPAFSLADATTQPLRRLRTWPALLTLYLLAPITGEVLSGSTPPLQFINPLSLLALTGLYGSGAIVARELVRRRGLGWPSLLLFGAAYGILEEGLVVTSWFNPKWPDLGFLYLGALLLAIGFLVWGLRLRPRSRPMHEQFPTNTPRPAPCLWWLRLAGFAGILLIFASAWVLPRLVPFPIVPILSMLAILGLGIWLLSRWTKRANWGICHRLAFISGVLAFFIALSPLVEFAVHPIGRITTGMTLFDLAFLAGLVFLAWHLRRRYSLIPVLDKIR